MNINNIIKFINKKNFSFFHFKNVSSTMEEIKKITGIGNKIVLADKQTNGYGRRGGKWHSPIGNIYVSILVNYNLDIKNHFIFNAITAISICQTLDSFCKFESKIKWPNDIILLDKKISGTISEIVKIENKNYIVIGAGINIVSSPNILNYPTIYFKKINKEINKNIIFYEFIKNFFNNYELMQESSLSMIIEEFKKRLENLGKMITIESDNQKILKGIMEDINSDGSILFNLNGKKENIYSARILNVK